MNRVAFRFVPFLVVVAGVACWQGWAQQPATGQPIEQPAASNDAREQRLAAERDLAAAKLRAQEAGRSEYGVATWFRPYSDEFLIEGQTCLVKLKDDSGANPDLDYDEVWAKIVDHGEGADLDDDPLVAGATPLNPDAVAGDDVWKEDVDIEAYNGATRLSEVEFMADVVIWTGRIDDESEEVEWDQYPPVVYSRGYVVEE